MKKRKGKGERGLSPRPPGQAPVISGSGTRSEQGKKREKKRGGRGSGSSPRRSFLIHFHHKHDRKRKWGEKKRIPHRVSFIAMKPSVITHRKKKKKRGKRGYPTRITSISVSNPLYRQSDHQQEEGKEKKKKEETSSGERPFLSVVPFPGWGPITRREPPGRFRLRAQEGEKREKGAERKLPFTFRDGHLISPPRRKKGEKERERGRVGARRARRSTYRVGNAPRREEGERRGEGEGEGGTGIGAPSSVTFSHHRLGIRRGGRGRGRKKKRAHLSPRKKEKGEGKKTSTEHFSCVTNREREERKKKNPVRDLHF